MTEFAVEILFDVDGLIEDVFLYPDGFLSYGKTTWHGGRSIIGLTHEQATDLFNVLKNHVIERRRQQT
jgi:hypothetical protein